VVALHGLVWCVGYQVNDFVCVGGRGGGGLVICVPNYMEQSIFPNSPYFMEPQGSVQPVPLAARSKA
jgi:hypothetical protein